MSLHLLPVTLFLLGTTPQVAEVPLEPPIPAVAWVVTPFGVSSVAGTSRIVREASDILQDQTSLVLQSVEQMGLDAERMSACRTESRITCWTQILRGELRQDSVPDATRPAPRFLVVFLVRPVDRDADRIGIQMIDLEEAIELVSQENQWGKEELEDILFNRAVRTPAVLVPEARGRGLTIYLERVIEDKLRPRFEQNGMWHAHGSMVVKSTCAGCTLTVDDRPLLATTGGDVRVVAVPPGRHRVGLKFQQASIGTCGVDVPRRAEARLDLDACGVVYVPPQSDAALMGVQYSGMGLAAVGAVLGVVAAVQASSGPTSVCVFRGDPPDDCPSLGLPQLGLDANPSPTVNPDDVNSGGIGTAPLAAGLATAGLSWWLGSYLVDNDAWWIPLVVGIAAGGATFGVTTALGGL